MLGLAGFLEQNQLVYPSVKTVARLAARSNGNQWLQWKWWVHHYLFFRVPLVRPQRWLAVVEPYLRWLFAPLTAWVVAGLGALGLILAARQWDVFQQTLVESVSPEGLAGFLIALAFAKTAHELGHALTATRYGVRVAHMGVAFLVLWPMLYTDTGESWRLRSRYQRLAVAGGHHYRVGDCRHRHAGLGSGGARRAQKCPVLSGDHRLGVVARAECEPLHAF